MKKLVLLAASSVMVVVAAVSAIRLERQPGCADAEELFKAFEL